MRGAEGRNLLSPLSMSVDMQIFKVCIRKDGTSWAGHLASSSSASPRRSYSGRDLPVRLAHMVAGQPDAGSPSIGQVKVEVVGCGVGLVAFGGGVVAGWCKSLPCSRRCSYS